MSSNRIFSRAIGKDPKHDGETYSKHIVEKIKKDYPDLSLLDMALKAPSLLDIRDKVFWSGHHLKIFYAAFNKGIEDAFGYPCFAEVREDMIKQEELDEVYDIYKPF